MTARVMGMVGIPLELMLVSKRNVASELWYYIKSTTTCDRSPGALERCMQGDAEKDVAGSRSAERGMPRLLPRLLKALQETPLTHTNSKHVAPSQDVGSRKRKSLYRPITVPLPSFHPAGRTRSILLDENPVTDKRAFARHKRLPPRVRLGPRPVVHGEHDVPREMTTQEREWWSSPYRAFDFSFPYFALVSN